MIQISGLAFNHKHEQKTAANLLVDEQGNASLSTQLNKSYKVSQLSISPRIANSTRFITFPNGSLFETGSNDSVDNAIKRFSDLKVKNRSNNNYSLVVVMLVAVLFSSWSLIHFGIPGVSHYVAMQVPEEMLIDEGQEAFERMDDKYFSESKITQDRQSEITAAFKGLLPLDSYQYKYQLHFRASETIGANALALPSGDIVITDDLVNLAKTDDEINSVLLHEIAHVELRHSVQSVVQTSVLLLGVVAITGDITSLSTVLFAIPALLLDSGYSRGMESEADDYSLAYMLEHDVDPIAFSNIMIKLTDSHEGRGEKESGYWSSHPPSDERIGRFRLESRKYKESRQATTKVDDAKVVEGL